MGEQLSSGLEDTNSNRTMSEFSILLYAIKMNVYVFVGENSHLLLSGQEVKGNLKIIVVLLTL